ncbi:hypothetical protein GCM10010400_40100 [Streptomyces aculeolatus]|uniref:hypothetical protein n=1 Tax=Streptomyces aculeolatus TaxID=270689 RepID=UPI001CECAE37|nr:hypothetical protein [Streptomyces aculeolatus]
MYVIFANFMRTAIPAAVGMVLTVSGALGLDVDSGTAGAVLTAVLTAAYYTAFRLVEGYAEKVDNAVLMTLAGVLLGWARPPETAPAAAGRRVESVPPSEKL